MELRADASRKEHCPRPSTSAVLTFPRTADATLTPGRGQRRVGWNALLLPRPLPFLGFASCLLPNALAMSTYANLQCPQTCGSRCGCASIVALRHRLCMLSADPVACVRTHSATPAHLRQGHARPHHSCGGWNMYAYAAGQRDAAGNTSQLVCKCCPAGADR